jgi:CRISPR/Cas system CSM-associated protein Csm3 (group 7 of RAMP superfamily)
MLVSTKTGQRILDIPTVSGNSLKGILRRKAGYKLLEILNINKKNLSESMQHMIFSGGLLRKGAGSGIIDTSFISKIRSNLPIISLFGSVAGQQMIASKLEVGQLIPISCQTQQRTGVESEISIYSLLDERAATRRDDMEDKPKGNNDDDQKQQMRYTHEVLIAGTEFYHYFTLKNCNELETGAFWSTLAEFNKYPKIGGLGSRGFGMIKMDYVIQSDSAQKYEAWVLENKDMIVKYILDLEAII